MLPVTAVRLSRRARKHVAGLVVLALAATACGGSVASPAPSGPASPAAPPSAVASPSPSPTPAPTPSPSPTPTPTPEPTPSPSPTPAPLTGLALEPVVDGIDHPLDVDVRPSDGMLFVSAQRGTIHAVVDGAPAETPLIDLSGVVNLSSIEQGLLGFAFHPSYPDDPRVFVYHSKADNNNVLVSYAHAGDPDVLDPSTRRELITIDKEPDKVRHNAGTVLFAPDGLLYVSVDDAERASINGQDPSTLMGTVLRIDVDAGGDRGYAIPDDNPWAEGGTPPEGVAGAPEVFWFGLRNPWRFSIDAESGLAYVGDVGQTTIEEVNVVPFDEGGINFGWPHFEGTDIYYSGIPAVSEVTAPVVQIVHEPDEGCSVTGGEVYRGAAIPELAGHYFYADWCYGWVRSFRYEDGQAADPQDWADDLADLIMISSFGHDADGELLVLDWEADAVFRVVPVREAP